MRKRKKFYRVNSSIKPNSSLLLFCLLQYPAFSRRLNSGSLSDPSSSAAGDIIDLPDYNHDVGTKDAQDEDETAGKSSILYRDKIPGKRMERMAPGTGSDVGDAINLSARDMMNNNGGSSIDDNVNRFRKMEPNSETLAEIKTDNQDMSEFNNPNFPFANGDMRNQVNQQSQQSQFGDGNPKPYMASSNTNNNGNGMMPTYDGSHNGFGSFGRFPENSGMGFNKNSHLYNNADVTNRIKSIAAGARGLLGPKNFGPMMNGVSNGFPSTMTGNSGNGGFVPNAASDFMNQQQQQPNLPTPNIAPFGYSNGNSFNSPQPHMTESAPPSNDNNGENHYSTYYETPGSSTPGWVSNNFMPYGGNMGKMGNSFGMGSGNFGGSQGILDNSQGGSAQQPNLDNNIDNQYSNSGGPSLLEDASGLEKDDGFHFDYDSSDSAGGSGLGEASSEVSRQANRENDDSNAILNELTDEFGKENTDILGDIASTNAFPTKETSSSFTENPAAPDHAENTPLQQRLPETPSLAEQSTSFYTCGTGIVADVGSKELVTYLISGLDVGENPTLEILGKQSGNLAELYNTGGENQVPASYVDEWVKTVVGAAGIVRSRCGAEKPSPVLAYGTGSKMRSLSPLQQNDIYQAMYDKLFGYSWGNEKSPYLVSRSNFRTIVGDQQALYNFVTVNLLAKTIDQELKVQSKKSKNGDEKSHKLVGVADLSTGSLEIAFPVGGAASPASSEGGLQYGQKLKTENIFKKSFYPFGLDEFHKTLLKELGKDDLQKKLGESCACGSAGGEDSSPNTRAQSNQVCRNVIREIFDLLFPGRIHDPDHKDIAARLFDKFFNRNEMDMIAESIKTVPGFYLIGKFGDVARDLDWVTSAIPPQWDPKKGAHDLTLSGFDHISSVWKVKDVSRYVSSIPEDVITKKVEEQILTDLEGKAKSRRMKDFRTLCYSANFVAEVLADVFDWGDKDGSVSNGGGSERLKKLTFMKTFRSLGATDSIDPLNWVIGALVWRRNYPQTQLELRMGSGGAGAGGASSGGSATVTELGGYDQSQNDDRDDALKEYDQSHTEKGVDAGDNNSEVALLQEGSKAVKPENRHSSSALPSSASVPSLIEEKEEHDFEKREADKRPYYFDYAARKHDLEALQAAGGVEQFSDDDMDGLAENVPTEGLALSKVDESLENNLKTSLLELSSSVKLQDEAVSKLASLHTAGQKPGQEPPQQPTTSATSPTEELLHSNFKNPYLGDNTEMMRIRMEKALHDQASRVKIGEYVWDLGKITNDGANTASRNVTVRIWAGLDCGVPDLQGDIVDNMIACGSIAHYQPFAEEGNAALVLGSTAEQKFQGKPTKYYTILHELAEMVEGKKNGGKGDGGEKRSDDSESGGKFSKAEGELVKLLKKNGYFDYDFKRGMKQSWNSGAAFVMDADGKSKATKHHDLRPRLPSSSRSGRRIAFAEHKKHEKVLHDAHDVGYTSVRRPRKSVGEHSYGRGDVRGARHSRHGSAQPSWDGEWERREMRDALTAAEERLRDEEMEREEEDEEMRRQKDARRYDPYRYSDRGYYGDKRSRWSRDDPAWLEEDDDDDYRRSFLELQTIIPAENGTASIKVKPPMFLPERNIQCVSHVQFWKEINDQLGTRLEDVLKGVDRRSNLTASEKDIVARMYRHGLDALTYDPNCNSVKTIALVLLGTGPAEHDYHWLGYDQVGKKEFVAASVKGLRDAIVANVNLESMTENSTTKSNRPYLDDLEYIDILVSDDEILLPMVEHGLDIYSTWTVKTVEHTVEHFDDGWKGPRDKNETNTTKSESRLKMCGIKGACGSKRVCGPNGICRCGCFGGGGDENDENDKSKKQELSWSEWILENLCKMMCSCCGATGEPGKKCGTRCAAGTSWTCGMLCKLLNPKMPEDAKPWKVKHHHGTKHGEHGHDKNDLTKTNTTTSENATNGNATNTTEPIPYSPDGYSLVYKTLLSSISAVSTAFCVRNLITTEADLKYEEDGRPVVKNKDGYLDLPATKRAHNRCLSTTSDFCSGIRDIIFVLSGGRLCTPSGFGEGCTNKCIDNCCGGETYIVNVDPEPSSFEEKYPKANTILEYFGQVLCVCRWLLSGDYRYSLRRNCNWIDWCVPEEACCPNPPKVQDAKAFFKSVKTENVDPKTGKVVKSEEEGGEGPSEEESVIEKAILGEDEEPALFGKGKKKHKKKKKHHDSDQAGSAGGSGQDGTSSSAGKDSSTGDIDTDAENGANIGSREDFTLRLMNSCGTFCHKTKDWLEFLLFVVAPYLLFMMPLMIFVWCFRKELCFGVWNDGDGNERDDREILEGSSFFATDDDGI